ncbi:hypothetical protein [Pseudorhodoplanes sp.]|uniref:hypothetical protein n=1 Tax=Pseudorhodoplanes sp. TaxID=1934341 RepID=UPI002CFB9C34|nr:hypothetical protein [Pseudorhodoplanes sp.]HWV53586.1 hypothetical protein [Pseudorhodoplanes sp.]
MTERRLFIRIELTASARARAEAAGLDANAATQSLDASVQVGDRISFGGDPADDFVVLRRRYLIGTGPAILVLELDHPARN